MNWINVNDSLPEFDDNFTRLSAYYSKDILLSDGTTWIRAQAYFNNDKTFKTWVSISGLKKWPTHWADVELPTI